MGHVSWLEIIKAGWPVLSVLLITSIIMVGVAWEKFKMFSRIQTNTEPFLKSVQAQKDPQKIIQWCNSSDQPLALITGNIFRADKTREAKERALSRSIQEVVHRVEARISTLGTIASVAPFIGLLGTVVGIIRAFRAISMTQGGASAVAVGIAEALVGTAAGLIVAIPALVLYNFFVNKIRRLTQDWELAGSDLIDLSLGQK